MKRPLFIITLEGVHGCGKTTTNTYFRDLIEKSYPELSKHVAFVTDSYVDLLPDLQKTFEYGSNYIREVTFFTRYITQLADLYKSGKSIIFTDRCLKSAPLYEAAMCLYDGKNDKLHCGATGSLIDLKHHLMTIFFKNIPVMWQILNVSRPLEILKKTLDKRNEVNPHPVEYKENDHEWTRMVYQRYEYINDEIIKDPVYGKTHSLVVKKRLEYYEKKPMEHVIHIIDNPLEGRNGEVQIKVIISIMCCLLKRCLHLTQTAHGTYLRRLESQDAYADLLNLMFLVNGFHKSLTQDKEVFDYGIKTLELKHPKHKALGICIFPSVFFSYDGTK